MYLILNHKFKISSIKNLKCQYSNTVITCENHVIFKNIFSAFNIILGYKWQTILKISHIVSAFQYKTSI